MKGESVACIFLEREGFTIVARNYQKKWGEIDVIAEKDDVLHFFEVKSVTAAYQDDSLDAHRPEDNVHAHKGRHIRRMVETYLFEHADGGMETEFHTHVLSVYLDLSTRKARVKWIKDVIL